MRIGTLYIMPKPLIAAIVVRVRKWITVHGLVLNLDSDMSHYELIVPCGFAGRPAISISKLIGRSEPPTTLVRLSETLGTHLRSLLTQSSGQTV
jgi:lipoate-protein ligase B